MKNRRPATSAVAVILLLLALLWMIVIFYLSGQSVKDSTSLSQFFCHGPARYLAEIDWLNAYAGIPQAKAYAFWLTRLDGIVRKTAHFTEYAVLAMILYGTLRLLQARILFIAGKSGMIAFIASVLFAVQDEWHQMFVPGRGPGVRDVFIDSCGAAFGIAVLWLLVFRKTKSRNFKA